MDGRPRVSVLVPAYHSHETLPVFLDSLRNQRFRRFEVIVVDSSPQDLVTPLLERYPEMRLHRHDGRLLPHQARNVAASISCGDILVFTDPDCRAEPDWLERLVEWHSQGRPAAGGAVAHEPGWWNAAVHFAKYPWWLPGGRAGERPEIPTANASFSRRVWEEVGPFQGDRFAGDSHFSWRLHDAGYRVWFDPAAIVTHLDHVRPRAFMRERFARGRDFGALRGETRRWTRTMYALRLLAAPLAPLVMTARNARYAAAAGQIGGWISSLPIQLLGNTLWCAGELTAHLRALRHPKPHSNAG